MQGLVRPSVGDTQCTGGSLLEETKTLTYRWMTRLFGTKVGRLTKECLFDGGSGMTVGWKSPCQTLIPGRT